MTLTINGTARTFDPPVESVRALLEALDLGSRPVVVELDREPILPAAYAGTRLADGAELEIVMIAAGG